MLTPADLAAATPADSMPRHHARIPPTKRRPRAMDLKQWFHAENTCEVDRDLCAYSDT